MPSLPGDRLPGQQRGLQDPFPPLPRTLLARSRVRRVLRNPLPWPHPAGRPRNVGAGAANPGRVGAARGWGWQKGQRRLGGFQRCLVHPWHPLPEPQAAPILPSACASPATAVPIVQIAWKAGGLCYRCLRLFFSILSDSLDPFVLKAFFSVSFPIPWTRLHLRLFFSVSFLTPWTPSCLMCLSSPLFPPFPDGFIFTASNPSILVKFCWCQQKKGGLAFVPPS